ncbi:MAG: dephospho-CoA kinase [Sphaerochaetaceae bacterium]|jgi:dephospho-CoA kinase|nr:dephospho-CoA kinase [Sphaerochaetaceae bacterium]MDD3162586.1 dephospho-CoA kinase [Sphaerochaetaceae bacterium]MDD4006505.1 dephospho-CoA kinase [Sphaerochaetaceae bacterium]MDD4395958.1 dephospho-CoA kinase [Sphaerochaetaceae bacterium]
MIIGVAGKSCSGKNYVVSYLEQEKHWQSIDVDEVGHDVIDQAASEVSRAFGSDVILPDGKVDRKAVGRIAFSDPAKLHALERIVHPKMVEKVIATVSECTSDVVIINAAILHRMKLDRLCNAVIFVKCPFSVRWHRAYLRNGTSKDSYIRRCMSQRDINSRCFCPGIPVYVVDNGNNCNKMHRQINRICDKLFRSRETEVKHG